MVDSTTMTIEFLRARLLSERSVSKAARQKADQLAKRVMELEEQLRIVTIQRKKAEKAAAEVVAILEIQGIGDLSEEIDSSSDGEVSFDDNQKEDESSTASRMERSEVEDGLSGSEPEVSPSQGRRLSWKSHSGADSHDKQRAKQIRQRQRRRSFVTALQSSSKHQLGKSCRKIKRNDVGSAADSETHKPILLHAQGNGGFTCSNYCDNQTDASVEISGGMIRDTLHSHHVKDHNRETEIHPCANGCGRDEDMERVLEKQAKLIGQFQAEENAQREWEEKYNENEISTLAHFEPGIKSLVAENGSQSKKEFSELVDRTPDYDEDATLKAAHISSSEDPMTESLSSSDKNDRSEASSNIGSDKNDRSGKASTLAFSHCSTTKDIIAASNAMVNDLVGQQSDGMVAKETKTISPEFTVSVPEPYGMIRNGKQNEVIPHDVSNGYQNNSRSDPHGDRTLEDSLSQTNSAIDNHSKLPKLVSQQKNQMQLQGELPQPPSSSLSGVLEALQRAKLSLRQELSKMPSPNQGTLALSAATDSQTRAIASADGLGIPIGSANLFRLPTDSFPIAQFSGPKFYGSGLSLPTNCESTSSYGYRNPVTSYMEGGSRVLLGREYFDNFFTPSLGVPDFNRYSRASSDLSAEGASFHREFSKSYSDVRNGMSPGDRYP